LARLLLTGAALIGLLAMHGASADHMLAPGGAATGQMIAAAGSAPHPPQKIAEAAAPAPAADGAIRASTPAARSPSRHAVLSSLMSADPGMTDCVAVLVEALGIALLAWLLTRRRGLGRETLAAPGKLEVTARRQRWRTPMTLPQLGISRT
jgi:hypothetical protein